MFLTADETKLHLRIDSSDEDSKITLLIATAQAAVASYLNMESEDLDTAAPAPVKSAALLMIGDLYANREAQSERPLSDNRAYERLLAPYRSY